MNARGLFIWLSAAVSMMVVTLSSSAAYADQSWLRHASIRQAAEMINFADGSPARGGGVLTRTATEVSVRLSTTDLDPDAAYSVWWIVFNRPRACLIAYACGESDIFSAPGVLNMDQIRAARISVFYADGFVTGADGTAYVAAHLAAGRLPTGTFVNFGWPIGQSGRQQSGLRAFNGLHAEMHMVVRTHGTAVAGAVGLQTSTFTGLCDVQACADQQAIVFPSPDAP